MVKTKYRDNLIIMDVVAGLRLSKASFATTSPVIDEGVNIWRR
jgi:hypothetical protein